MDPEMRGSSGAEPGGEEAKLRWNAAAEAAAFWGVELAP
jgi:hypothetical protein